MCLTEILQREKRGKVLRDKGQEGNKHGGVKVNSHTVTPLGETDIGFPIMGFRSISKYILHGFELDSFLR